MSDLPSPPDVKLISVTNVKGQLYALGDDGKLYLWNDAARLNYQGKWEISGADTSDFRHWIPLPPPVPTAEVTNILIKHPGDSCHQDKTVWAQVRHGEYSGIWLRPGEAIAVIKLPPSSHADPS